MRKSDNCTNLTVGGRQYQYSHLFLVLCNNNCCHKTETVLHYSHITPSVDAIGTYFLDELCILHWHLWNKNFQIQLELSQFCLWSKINFFIHHHHQHLSVLPKGRSFTANSGTKAAVLLKGRSSTANSGTKVAVLLGMNRCGIFQFFFSLPLSNTWTVLKISPKIQELQRAGEESGFGELGPPDFTEIHHRG